MTCPPSFSDKTSLSMSAAPACGSTRRQTANTINTSFFMQRSDDADEMAEDRVGFSTLFFQARPVVEGPTIRLWRYRSKVVTFGSLNRYQSFTIVPMRAASIL